jgi:AcrR family transcriptional regulator
VLRGDITVAIRNAVMHELAEVGYGRLSIEAVARRAGVGKTAIYRRWNNKLEMVLEIVSDVAGRAVPLPDTGSFAGDLQLLMMIVSKALQHRIASQIIPDLMAEAARNPQIAETLQNALRTHQQAVGDKLVGQAVARGAARRRGPGAGRGPHPGSALLAARGRPHRDQRRLPGGADRGGHRGAAQPLLRRGNHLVTALIFTRVAWRPKEGHAYSPAARRRHHFRCRLPARSCHG